jgi:general secretion pathway protein I
MVDRARQTSGGFARSSLGFSLLEMLVALSILGLVLGMVYEASTGAVRNAKVAEDYSYAMLFAQSLQNEYGQHVPPGFRASGELEEFSWSVRARPIAPVDALPQIQLQELETRVEWGSLRRREFVLNTVVGVFDEAR